ncbi:glycoside hydrolase family 18 protein [Sodiomyces alcalophilus JCM 7366]|uniref:glycoside hydrolase family 18 protein n=1 Tax=Sodiomyces alcalophilus JCM 7366 TaxID=591952 RepID=UPI0039B56212
MLARSLVALLSLTAGLSGALPANKTGCHSQPAGGYQNAVYFTNWAIYDRDYHPQDLPASQLTHVLYAFLNLRENGEVYSGDTWADVEKRYPDDSWNDPGTNAYGCVKQLFLLKKANRHLKTLLSIGGWTWSTNFPAVASTPQTRATFARTAVEFMKDWGFDGIDVDWEYPRDDTEAANQVELLRAVRDELDRYAAEHAPGYHFLLTIASPAGPSHYNQMRLAELADVIDNFYLMAYDFAGSWDSVSGHQANLYPNPNDATATPFSVDGAVQGHLDAGVPASHIVLGMPIYGRDFLNTDGPGEPYSGIGQGSWEAGVWDYKDLPRPGATVQFDNVAQASYSYDNSKRHLVSYDTPRAVESKVIYLQARGLAGSMFWEASGDRTGAESLLQTSFEALGGTGGQDSTENLLEYPDSQFANIRHGME